MGLLKGVGASPCVRPLSEKGCYWHAGAHKVTPLRPLTGRRESHHNDKFCQKGGVNKKQKHTKFPIFVFFLSYIIIRA
jgi:hypothetical protein